MFFDKGGRRVMLFVLALQLAIVAFSPRAIAQPVADVGPTTLWFRADESRELLSVSNVGTGDLIWSISALETWLSVTPAAGTNDATLLVQVDRSGLADGTHYGSLEVTSNGGNVSIQVVMVVNAGPILSVSTSPMEFTSLLEAKCMSINNEGNATLSWTISADQPWILFNPASGIDKGFVEVDVDRVNIPPGPQSGILTVTSNAGVREREIIFTPGYPPTNGTIGVYADVAGVNCMIEDDAPGLLTVHIVHTNTTGATACEFAAPLPACMTGATWLGDSNQFAASVGNTQTGLGVGYGTCLATPIHVTSIHYSVTGNSQVCCEYPVVPHPGRSTGFIHTVDCNMDLNLGKGATSIVNCDGVCTCVSTVRTEETTWGRLKALYAGE